MWILGLCVRGRVLRETTLEGGIRNVVVFVCICGCECVCVCVFRV